MEYDIHYCLFDMLYVIWLVYEFTYGLYDISILPALLILRYAIPYDLFYDICVMISVGR